ncbi:MAG TPA: hypothetical protein V6D08_13105 [Candidatus Obscuribacterales bacterium]
MTKYTAVGLALGLLIFVSVVLLGCAYSWSQPVVYETQARIWVQPRLAQALPTSQQTSLYAPLTAFFNSPIATAGEVLRSDIVLREAHALLRDRLPPDRCPPLDSLRSINVVPVSNADIIVVRYRDRDPNICKAVLDAVIDAFSRVNSSQAAQSAIQARKYLEKELADARQANLKAREDLKNFQEEEGTVDLDEQVAQMLRVIAELDLSIKKGEKALAENRSRIGFLQSQLKVSPEDAMLAQRLNLDETVKGLKTKIAADEIRLVDFSTKLKDAHPRIQQLKLSIAESKEALRERVRSIIGDAGWQDPGARLYADDPVQQKMLSDMINSRADEIAQETALTTLRTELAAAQARLADVPDKQLKLAELLRAVDVTKQAVSETERNLQSTRLMETVAAKASNIQVLDRPQVPGAPVQTRAALGVLVSVALGAVLGFFAFAIVYFLNPAVQRVKQAVDLVPLPIVGWIETVVTPKQVEDVLPGLQRLRVNLRNWLTGPHKRLVVSSGDPEDGKTILAAGLAISLARSGMRVVIIDTNFLNPSLHEILNAPKSPGLSDYLAAGNGSPPDRIIHPLKENLLLIPAGSATVFSGVLESPAFRSLLARMESQADVVILDTAAVTESSDALSLLDRNAHLLVVVRLKHTYVESLRLLSTQLKHQEMAGGGTVFFGADERAVLSAMAAEVPVEAPPPVPAGQPAPESSRW